jgi:hypothetical protein
MEYSGKTMRIPHESMNHNGELPAKTSVKKMENFLQRLL